MPSTPAASAVSDATAVQRLLRVCRDEAQTTRRFHENCLIGLRGLQLPMAPPGQADASLPIETRNAMLQLHNDDKRFNLLCRGVCMLSQQIGQHASSVQHLLILIAELLGALGGVAQSSDARAGPPQKRQKK